MPIDNRPDAPASPFDGDFAGDPLPSSSDRSQPPRGESQPPEAELLVPQSGPTSPAIETAPESAEAKAVRAEIQGPSVFDSAKTAFVRFWSSVKLAVVLIVLIALASTIGTIIPQGDKSGVLGIVGMSDRAKNFLIAIQAYDVYYSPWYLGLLALFFLNLAVCTYVRVWPRLKFALARPRDIPESARDNLPEQLWLPGVGVDQVRAGLKKKLYRTFPTQDGGLAADRNRLFRFAPMVVHIGLFMILIGGITAGLAGYKDSFPMLPGDTMSVHQTELEASHRGPLTPDPGNWKVHLDKFWMTHYPDGAIKQYYSTLSVVDRGKTVKTETIHVNDPLRYRGVWFYQSFFGIGAENLVVDRGIQSQILLRHQDGVSLKLAGYITSKFPLPAGPPANAAAGGPKPATEAPQLGDQPDTGNTMMGGTVKDVFFYTAGPGKPFYMLAFPMLQSQGSLSPGHPLVVHGHTYSVGPEQSAPGVSGVILTIGGHRRLMPIESAGRFKISGYISHQFPVGTHKAFLYLPDVQEPVQIVDLDSLATMCTLHLHQSAKADGVEVTYSGRTTSATAGGLASAQILQDGKPMPLQLVDLAITGFRVSGPASDPFEIGGKGVIAIQNSQPPGSPLWLMDRNSLTADAILNPGDTVQIGHDLVRYAGPVWFSGLQTKSDPAIPVIYSGFFIVIAGTLIGMFSHRQLYVTPTADGCKIAAKANRGQYLLHQELGRFAQALGVHPEVAFAKAGESHG